MSAETTRDNLVQLFRNSKNLPHAQKPVFWLGAGCSVFDGVPLNATLLKDVLGAPPPGAWGSPQHRFDTMFKGSSAAWRAGVLIPHLTPSIKADSPYHGLVQLLKRGYADIVLTFNIDDVLQHALEAALKPGEYRILSAPELTPEALVRAVLQPPANAPRITIVLLHGDVHTGINFMTSSEIIHYEPGLAQICGELSLRPAVVCGYSFTHLNVLQAFRRVGGPMFYASPSFPDTPMVLSLMQARNQGTPNFIDGDLGRFHNLITDLVTQLP